MSSENHRPFSTVLIVDDETGPREALKFILRQNFRILVAENAAAALHILDTQPVDLVTLDQRLPDKSGLDLLRDIKRRHADVEVIIITGYGCLKSAMESLHQGAAGYLLKPFNTSELTALVAQTVHKKQRLDFIRSTLRSSPDLWNPNSAPTAWQTFRKAYCSFLADTESSTLPPPDRPWPLLLSDVLEAVDRRLWNHSYRVSFYAGLLGEQLRLDASLYEQLTIGTFLHDIGKIHPACSPPVNHPPACGCLPEIETHHSLLGAELLQWLEFSNEIIDTVRYHHERWDGSGSPHRRRGEEIPFLARIASMTEAFDDWTVNTNDHESLTIEEAVRHLSQESHVLFDPALVEPFIDILAASQSSLPPLAASPFINQPVPSFPPSLLTHEHRGSAQLRFP